jgi:hypothetical protein
MNSLHAKAVRRRILLFLYARYQQDPTEMVGPEVFITEQGFTKADLVFHMHYLSDHRLVELAMGYAPPLFASVRLTGQGVDVVEHPFELDRRFPAAPEESGDGYGDLPVLLERLLVEAECASLDGEARRGLLRDVLYLREEVARPVADWRPAVLGAVLTWIAAPFDDAAEELPSLVLIQARLAPVLGA